jgi:ABC-2 type transport system ATP-binding protein
MIRIRNLTKDFAGRRAVDDISFTVDKGEIVGFLGPNGAGKTTTMRLLTGFLMPSSGDVWIAGHNMATERLQGQRRIGYLPEIVPLYTDMRTRAYLAFTARLRGLGRREAHARADDVIEQCGLEAYADAILGKLSKGYRQRVGLAQAIIHDPDVLILDEPTSAIDPIQVVQTKSLIRNLGKDRTILLSTHILPEVAAICERVIIIHRGRILAEDRIENLSTLLRGGRRLRLSVQGPAEAITARLLKIETISGVAYAAPYHLVEFLPEREPQAMITRVVVEEGWTLLSMEMVGLSLEEIFLQLTAGGGAKP